MFMFVLNILCHNLLGTNRPEGWVRTDRKWVRNVWIRKIHEYETTGNRNEENLTWKMFKNREVSESNGLVGLISDRLIENAKFK